MGPRKENPEDLRRLGTSPDGKRIYVKGSPPGIPGRRIQGWSGVETEMSRSAYYRVKSSTGARDMARLDGNGPPLSLRVLRRSSSHVYLEGFVSGISGRFIERGPSGRAETEIDKETFRRMTQKNGQLLP